MDELVMIKLGGSVITEKGKGFTENRGTIRRLAREIHEAREETGFKLIIAHGGGSYPHVPAKEFNTKMGVIDKRSHEGIAKVQNAAARLNMIVVEELMRAGENAMSIQPSCSCVTRDGEMKEWYLKPVRMLLDNDMVPVPYGDVALDSEKGCTIVSTEDLLSYISGNAGEELPEYSIKRIITAGRVDGVYRGFKTESQELVEKITPSNFEEIREHIMGSEGIDVTGGMLHRVERMLELTGLGIQTDIVNATKPGLLKRALLGEPGLGTIITGD